MKMDTVSAIMALESGELDAYETVELFSKLVKNGTAWSLQGSYGRAAKNLIERGVLDSDGNIDHDVLAGLLGG